MQQTRRHIFPPAGASFELFAPAAGAGVDGRGNATDVSCFGSVPYFVQNQVGMDFFRPEAHPNSWLRRAADGGQGETDS